MAALCSQRALAVAAMAAALQHDVAAAAAPGSPSISVPRGPLRAAPGLRESCPAAFYHATLPDGAVQFHHLTPADLTRFFYQEPPELRSVLASSPVVVEFAVDNSRFPAPRNSEPALDGDFGDDDDEIIHPVYSPFLEKDFRGLRADPHVLDFRRRSRGLGVALQHNQSATVPLLVKISSRAFRESVGESVFAGVAVTCVNGSLRVDFSQNFHAVHEQMPFLRESLLDEQFRELELQRVAARLEVNIGPPAEYPDHDALNRRYNATRATHFVRDSDGLQQEQAVERASAAAPLATMISEALQHVEGNWDWSASAGGSLADTEGQIRLAMQEALRSREDTLYQTPTFSSTDTFSEYHADEEQTESPRAPETTTGTPGGTGSPMAFRREDTAFGIEPAAFGRADMAGEFEADHELDPSGEIDSNELLRRREFHPGFLRSVAAKAVAASQPRRRRSRPTHRPATGWDILQQQVVRAELRESTHPACRVFENTYAEHGVKSYSTTLRPAELVQTVEDVTLPQHARQRRFFNQGYYYRSGFSSQAAAEPDLYGVTLEMDSDLELDVLAQVLARSSAAGAAQEEARQHVGVRPLIREPALLRRMRSEHYQAVGVPVFRSREGEQEDKRGLVPLWPEGRAAVGDGQIVWYAYAQGADRVRGVLRKTSREWSSLAEQNGVNDVMLELVLRLDAERLRAEGAECARTG
eukprot:g13946.t1